VSAQYVVRAEAVELAKSIVSKATLVVIAASDQDQIEALAIAGAFLSEIALQRMVTECYEGSRVIRDRKACIAACEETAFRIWSAPD
jgi:hypothetical protein